jgi:hypothetical protein
MDVAGTHSNQMATWMRFATSFKLQVIPVFGTLSNVEVGINDNGIRTVLFLGSILDPFHHQAK